MGEKDNLETRATNEIDSFLARPLLARLATASPVNCQPHVVPVWFLWDGEAIWVNSYRSTRKISELEENPNCAIVVDTTEKDAEFQGVLLEGQADIFIDLDGDMREMILRIYSRYLGVEGVKAPEPQEWVKSPEASLIRLKPKRVITW